jgi:1-acyl-sn-glycerol-3-phosphate acyltransferase
MNILLSIVVWLIGIAFLTIMFPVTFIIWLLAIPFDKKRAVIHWVLVYESILLTRLVPIWQVRFEGRENALKNKTFVIISNHQSIMDILFLNELRMRFKWISTIETTRTPFIGWYLRMADYITVDRGNSESKEEMLLKSYSCLKNGTSIMIFPEGTRSQDKQIAFFKRGAFQLAISARVPILPVVIDGTGGVLPKHGLIFSGGHKIRVKILKPVYPDSFGTSDPDELAGKLRKLMIPVLNDLRNL